MTVEEQHTMHAIQNIDRTLRKISNDKSVDWEQRRYEIAKDILAASRANVADMIADIDKYKHIDPNLDPEDILAAIATENAREALVYADILVGILKDNPL